MLIAWSNFNPSMNISNYIHYTVWDYFDYGLRQIITLNSYDFLLYHWGIYA